jgi:DNA-binding Lrp family transcriptional regulator
MIREITKGALDDTDERIIQILRRHGGSRIVTLADAMGRSEGMVRYRLLTLEACGIVQADRERGVTRYFLKKKVA